MARKKRGRKLDAILLLDKPEGLSSNHALQRVKRLFDAQKAGHTGALDPIATGVLPICFGHATKASTFMLVSDKSYQAKIHLGETRTTGDREGETLDTVDISSLTVEQIQSVLAEFVGEQMQVPPMYSALKKDGKPLYEYARQGIEIERDARPITIYSLEFVSYEAPYLIIDVACSKGTYIRTLAEDIGSKLGVGAFIEDLRRTSVAGFEGDKIYTLDELEAMESKDDVLLPVDAALQDVPKIKLNTKESHKVRNGQVLDLGDYPSEDLIRMYDVDDQFIGVGEVKQSTLYIKRLMV